LLWSAQVDAVEPRLHDVEEGLAGATPAELTPTMARRALAGEMAAIRAELARQRGELDTAITLAHRALADLPTQAQQVRGVTMGLLGGTYLSSGDAVAASQAYEDALAASQAAGTMTLALFAGGRLVQVQALHGQLRQAATTYRRTLELAAGHGLAATPAVGVAQVGMGEVLREWNDLEAADDLLREGIARCAGVGGLAEVALEGCLTLARVLQARGDTAGALAAFDRAEALGYAGHVPQSAERVATARVRLWLTTTPVNLAEAMRWAKARRTDEQFGYTALLARLTLARLRLMYGTPEEAATLLQPLLMQAEAGGLTGKVIEILVLQARASLGLDQPAQAMIALSRALALAELEGYLRVFLDEGAPMVALLQQAHMRGVAPAYVATLLAAGGARDMAGAAATARPDPLSAREVELLRLVATGLSAREAAAQLFITAGTARIHLKHIYRKLDVHNRVQAVERARALGLV
jgi:LuxR family maltose regulon positive regulatory protein